MDALVEPIDRMGWKLGEYGNINSKVAKEISFVEVVETQRATSLLAKIN